jgi:hypothetical protein
MSPPRNVAIHLEGMEIIANIIEKYDKESRQKQLLLPINKATERAAMYTGKSRSSVLRIRRKNRERKATNPTQLLKSPGKKRGKRSRDYVFVDDFDKCVIRNTIQDFYIQGKKVPTIPKLLPIIKRKYIFIGDVSHWRGL